MNEKISKSEKSSSLEEESLNYARKYCEIATVAFEGAATSYRGTFLEAEREVDKIRSGVDEGDEIFIHRAVSLHNALGTCFPEALEAGIAGHQEENQTLARAIILQLEGYVEGSIDSYINNHDHPV